MQQRPPAGPPRRAAPRQDAFEEFQASVLFCNRCRAPQPVRERLLLVLPDGDLLEYRCTGCNGSLGSRRTSSARPPVVIG